MNPAASVRVFFAQCDEETFTIGIKMQSGFLRFLQEETAASVQKIDIRLLFRKIRAPVFTSDPDLVIHDAVRCAGPDGTRFLFHQVFKILKIF